MENNREGEYMANIVTICRIVCSMLMLFSPAFSFWFYILYLFCGFTDMVDGTIARKTNTASEFGAILDTVADFIFVGICLAKLLPVMHIPNWLWIWIAVIVSIKTSNIVSGFICMKRFVAEHTLMNKVTGLFLFLLPLTLFFIELKHSAIVVCSIATFSAIQEGHYIRTGREIA